MSIVETNPEKQVDYQEIQEQVTLKFVERLREFGRGFSRGS